MRKNFANFSLLDKVIPEYGNLDLKKNVKTEISKQLEGLRESFNRYFYLGESETWVVNLFGFKLERWEMRMNIKII